MLPKDMKKLTVWVDMSHKYPEFPSRGSISSYEFLEEVEFVNIAQEKQTYARNFIKLSEKLLKDSLKLSV